MEVAVASDSHTSQTYARQEFFLVSSVGMTRFSFPTRGSVHSRAAIHMCPRAWGGLVTRLATFADCQRGFAGLSGASRGHPWVSRARTSPRAECSPRAATQRQRPTWCSQTVRTISAKRISAEKKSNIGIKTISAKTTASGNCGRKMYFGRKKEATFGGERPCRRSCGWL